MMILQRAALLLTMVALIGCSGPTPPVPTEEELTNHEEMMDTTQDGSEKKSGH